jgi:hypothetical protein
MQSRRNRYEVVIPPGLKPVSLPKNIAYEDDFVKLERLAQIENDRVVTQYALDVKVLMISPEQYPKARESFLKAFDASGFVVMFEADSSKKKS